MKSNKRKWKEKKKKKKINPSSLIKKMINVYVKYSFYVYVYQLHIRRNIKKKETSTIVN